MVAKLYFEETFSVATAQALQVWAQTNLIAVPDGNYGMRISYVATAPMFAETEITGLTIGRETTLRIDVKDALSNGGFAITVNELANDNSSSIAEIGYGLGQRTLIFTPTAETMYLAVGMESTCPTCFVIVDNVTTSVGTIVNGTFEDGTTTGWYGQNTNAALEAYEYNVEPPVGDNPYLIPVYIPVYDAGDPTHVLITTSNGNESLLNDTSKQHFYVEPGDYSAEKWRLTTAGTDVARRTISLHNISYPDAHPGAMPMNLANLMNVTIDVRASYWTLDRVTALSNSASTNSGLNISIVNGAIHTIINRAFQNNCATAAHIKNYCHNTSIQQCRFQNQAASSINADRPYVMLNQYQVEDVVIHDTRIIANEMVNGNDCIQLVRSNDGNPDSQYQTCDFAGTIIDSNNLWADGTHQALLENAIDLKAASEDPLNPVVVTNNNMWGWNENNTQQDGGRIALVAHYSPKNVQIEDNNVWDSSGGLGTGSNGPSSGFAYGLIDSTMKNNLIYQCGNVANNDYPMSLGSILNTVVEDNAIVDCVHGYLSVGSTDNTNTCQYNDLANGTPNAYEDRGNNGSTFLATLANNVPNASGYTEDLIIDYDIYTDTPKQITLVNARKP